MTIELFTGFVGSGKSYSAIQQGLLVATSMSNKYVVANFPVTKEKRLFYRIFKKGKKHKSLRWIYKTNEQLTVDYLVEKSLEMGWNKKESSCLLIFDEASIPFNSRTSIGVGQKERLNWIKFLSQSRKFGYDVIFITQSAGMLDRQIRDLCEYECVHKKMNNYALFKILGVFKLTLFAQVRYWNGMNNRYSKGSLRLLFYRNKVGKRYDTLKLFD